MTNPLSIAGYPVDPESGEPQYVKVNARQKAQEDRYKNLIAESAEIVNELSDDRGLIVKEAVRLFTDRINFLIANDPQCQVFEALFNTIKFKVDAGKRIAGGKAAFL